jgi:hypothetical protein
MLGPSNIGVSMPWPSGPWQPAQLIGIIMPPASGMGCAFTVWRATPLVVSVHQPVG